jgi:hypothetical protein
MRQYGEVPPWLAANNTPAVVSATGLGTGGGASVSTPDSSGFGDVLVRTGPGASASWSIVLAFPNTPPTLFVSGDDAFGVISQATVSKQITLSGTGGSFVNNGQTLKIHYEWSVSK